MNELIVKLEWELKTLEKKRDQFELSLMSGDRSGDWGSDNETLGHYCGEIEQIRKILVELKKLN